jgi:DNA-binding winged helix-turn-helix (wHTH) protein/tetratricopeptide (TPR) repeat protein
MENLSQLPKIIRFGPFEADLKTEKLLRNGVPVRLQDQPLRLLLLLLQHPGEIVSREELRSRLWPEDSYGEFDNGLNVAVRKIRAALGDDAGSPRFVETVTRRGYRFIAETEVDSPIALPQATRGPDMDSAAVLACSAANETHPAPNERTFDARRVLLTLLGVMFPIIVIAAVLVLRHRSIAANRSPVSARESHLRRSVAVLGFRNSSGQPEDAWLSTALSEMFSTELAAGDHLRLVSGEDVVHVRMTQPGLDVDSLSSNTSRQLGRALDTDLIVCGSYAAVASGGTRLVRLDVRLQDADSGEILTEVSSAGSEETLFQLVGNAGEHLRQKLGVSGLSAEERSRVVASMPSNRDAGELYSNGLLKLRAYDAMAAKTLLEQSIAAEPGFPLAHSALSDAWAHLGYDQRAVDEAQKAYDLASTLLPSDRLQVQARYWAAKGEWEKSAKAYGSLYASFPDNQGFAIQFADCLTRAGRGKDALALLEPLGAARSAGAGKDSAGVELAIAEADSALGNMTSASQSAETAAAMAKKKGQILLAARALRTEGLALEDLKQYAKALAVTDEARQIFANAGDRLGIASVLEVQGNVLSDQGNLMAALEKYQMELEIVRDVGNKRGQASALNNMALVFNQQGDLERSRTMWEQAQAAFRELGDKSNTAVVLVNLGGVFKDKGDLAQAANKYEKALALSREMNDASGASLALNALGTVSDAQGNFSRAKLLLRQSLELQAAGGQRGPSSENLVDTADVLLHQGNLRGARKAYDDALAASQASGEKSWSAYAYFGLARIALYEADFAGAQRNLEVALQLRRELGELFTVAETEMALAELGVEQGQADKAEPTLRSVREVFLKAGKQDDSVTSSTILIDSLLSQGKTSEARRELATMPAVGRIQQIDTRLAAFIAEGRVSNAEGRHPEGRLSLRSAVEEANRNGYYRQAFEARLALLNCETDSNNRKKKRSELSREARQAGFVLVANHADSESVGRIK